jgi:hypothetical protein
MNRNLSTTKWGRTFHDRNLIQAIRVARCKYFNDYDQHGVLPIAKGISRTVLPDGSVKTYRG